MSNKTNYTDAEAQFLKNVGFRVQYFRHLTDLSQDQLAEITGLSPSTISHIEATAPYVLSLKSIYRIASALGVEPYQLLKFD